MAGRKQHYIPQVVQRAFEASRTGTKSQVFVFRKGQPEYLTSTEGSGAERDFYSNPLKDGKGALDDKITDFEGEHLTPILRVLRAMATMVGSAVGQMKSIVEDPSAIRRFSGIDSMRSDSAMIERVREELLNISPHH